MLKYTQVERHSSEPPRRDRIRQEMLDYIATTQLLGLYQYQYPITWVPYDITELKELGDSKK